MDAVGVIFVCLGPEHVGKVETVERDSFALSWSKDDLRTLLANADVVCIGVLDQGELVAYGLGYDQIESFHLASMAVAPGFRRRGIGEALLRRLLGEAKERGCARCTLEVRVGNCAARRLYSRAGFTQLQQMKDYYEDPIEDGLELVLAEV